MTGAIAKIHIAKTQLGLDDETYRALLARVTGKHSSRDLNDREVDVVLGEFKRLGWRAKGGFRKSDKPYVRLVYALWSEAGRVGAVRDTGKTALRAFVGRQLNGGAEVARDPEFLMPAEANKVAEGLKAMIKRTEDRACESKAQIDA